MRKPCFSKIAKFFAVALLSAAAAIAAVAVLSSPATAEQFGGGGDSDDYPWDTDNLRYGRYNAKSFNIPFHDYDGYSGVAACQKNVADSFFQTDNSVVNDFPRLVPSGSGDSMTWSIAAGSAGNNAGCDTFVAQQDKLAAQVVSGLTYGLSEDGKVQPVGGAAFTTGRSVSDLNYVTWTAKASSDYTIAGTHGATTDVRYYRRADGVGDSLAITPSSAAKTITVPNDSSARRGRFGAAWHGTRVTGGYHLNNYRVALYPSLARHLTKAKSDALCRNFFHPRGEDSYERIGGSTGRSLTGLSHADGKIADRFWCRSDWRYERRFAVEVHDLPDGIIAYAGAPASGTFTAYGRLGCYYTVRRAQKITGTTAYKCIYLFPLPKCDPNPGNGSDSDWRYYTNEEIQDGRLAGKVLTKADGDPCAAQCTHNGSKRDMTEAEIREYTKDDVFFVPKADGTTPCVKSAAPPQQAGFTADPCVTASLVIYENRTAGSDAEPGVTATDRTLVVATGRTAWDLDVTSPHHNTASPPRDVASTPADATGCAGGSESRADHSSDAGSAVRKNTAAGVDLALPVSSVAGQSTHPPHSKGFDSAGTDYSGAVKNMAHRYASGVAENACAAKRAEAEMVLSEMKARRLAFQRYIESYESSLDAAIGVFGGYRANTQAGSDLGLKVRQYNAEEARRADYVALRKAHLDKLKLALADAERKYQTASNQSVTALTSDSGCVAAYDTKITNLRTVQKNAETAFPSTVSSRAGISSVNTHLRNFNAQAGPNLNAGRITFIPETLPVLERPTSPSWIAGATSSTTTYHCNTGSETGFSLTSDNKCTKTVSTTSYVYTSPTETEEEGETVYTCPTGTTLIKIVFGITACRRSVTTPRTETGTVSTTITSSWTETHSSGPHTGTIIGSYTDPTTTPGTLYTKTIRYSLTFTGSRSCSYATGHDHYSTRCDTASHRVSGRTPAQAKAMVEGTKPAVTPTPGFSPPTKPAAHANMSNIWLLGKYHTQHPDRSNLVAASTSVRDTAAINLGSLSAGNITTAATGATYTPQNIANLYVPTSWTGSAAASRRSDIQTEANDYKSAYTSAYNNAYTQATTDMGSTATTSTWNRFDWRYQTSTLDWGSYQEDPATTYSGWVAQAGETEADRDGTGCDLIAVAADGGVSVEATRLDYETSKYGKGNVFGTRTDAQRSCKIRRTRTPELLLEYQPSAPSGTDTSKATTFWHVNYQPTSAAERFKLYNEAEVFAVKASLADRAPVLCYQPGEGLWINSESVDLIYLVRPYSNGPSCHPKLMACSVNAIFIFLYSSLVFQAAVTCDGTGVPSHIGLTPN